MSSDDATAARFQRDPPPPGAESGQRAEDGGENGTRAFRAENGSAAPRPRNRDVPTRTVLFAARSAVALYRLLDVLPVLSGDDRITRLFTLVPGSDFGADTLAAIDALGGRTVPWTTACGRSYDLIVAASPKGDLRLLRGPHVLLPHGAGFNKSIPGEGSADSASGLDPAYLHRAEHDAPIALHALAHPDQVARVAATAPEAARHAKVIGDLTLERVLASWSLRERYRTALGTGARTLLALVSTWGPESLIRRNPALPARLASHLPHDEYQLALVVHPNERSLLGTYELTERLAPALDAGMVLPDPHEEWASVLIAADAVVTDHGSAALYFCAAQDRPVVGVHPGGGELIPGTPMGALLDRTPLLGHPESLLDHPESLVTALRAYRPGPARAAAEAAFAPPGDAVDRMRTEVYALLGLARPAHAVRPRLLRTPAPAPRVPAAFDVHVETTEAGIRITRHPAGTGPPGHHLAAEHGAAHEHLARSAGLLYRRPLPASAAPVELTWTAEGWTRHTLAAYPGCRAAAALLPSGGCLLRVRGQGRTDQERTYAVETEPRAEGDRVLRVDPAVALSAAHATLLTRPPPPGPATLTCWVGDHPFQVTLRPPTGPESTHPV
ncbi:translation initiation factor 2 [Streptomyces sp. NPDC093085]|uniref:translation initiation factor 2 n=1 Tax=Streptomyces sp. NPDC093085 TaxID=3155068 RepID=UPI00342F2CB1